MWRSLEVLELLESLLGACTFADFENVEPDGFAQRAALADGDDIAEFDVSETRGQMNRHVFVPFFESVVLPDVVEVISSNDDGPLHFHLLHGTCKVRKVWG